MSRLLLIPKDDNVASPDDVKAPAAINDSLSRASERLFQVAAFVLLPQPCFMFHIIIVMTKIIIDRDDNDQEDAIIGQVSAWVTLKE